MNDGFEEGTFTRRPLKITESKNKQKKQEKEKTEKEKQLMKQKREEKILISKVERKKKDAEGVQKKKEQKKKKVEKQEDLDVENLDTNVFSEVDETRQPVNIVFIGHVDAGKSTICGNILLMTGKVDSKDLRKFQMEAKEKNRDSWYLAYIMDINEEERSKGKTVEVGKAHFETVSKRFTILDAPGHKNYVPNMIQGASQADIAAMVISAKKGEFEAGFEKGG